MDLNDLYFTKEKLKYILYQVYFSQDNITRIGLKIVDLNNNKIKSYKGVLETQNGSLVKFRENERIKQGEDLFD